MRETSREAYEAIMETGVAAALKVRVLAHLKGCGSRGATDREVEAALGVPAKANIRTRRKSLQREGLVVDSGRTRRPIVDGLEEGRRATVWVYAPHGPEPEPDPGPELHSCPVCGGSGKIPARVRGDDGGQLRLWGSP